MHRMRERGSPRLAGILATGVLLALLPLTACVEYSIDPQGNLQSVGLPRVPVWQTQTLADQRDLAAKGDLAAPPGSMADPKAERFRPIASDAAWLAHVNRWRTMAGVAPVGEYPWLSLGSTQHAQYLVKNGPPEPAAFRRYAQALGAAAHSEVFGNDYWTGEGEKAGHYGGIAWDKDAVADADGLLIAPFHRLPILAPWAKVGGYGEYGRWPRRAGVLVVRGATPVGVLKPVFFPPEGVTMPTGAMTATEFPDPLAACPGYALPVGLPITLQVGPSIYVWLESYVLEDETSGREVETCGFDARTYPDRDGQQVLSSYGAVVLVPRQPLAADHAYRVNVKSHRATYTWTFRVEQTPPTVRRVHDGGGRRPAH